MVKNSVVTLSLCQCQARHILKDTDVTDTWLLFIGSAMPDKKYSLEHMHGVGAWRDCVAGRYVATAKVDKLLAPATAKSKFSRHRPDTGACCSYALAFLCSLLFRHVGEKEGEPCLLVSAQIRTPDTTENVGFSCGHQQGLCHQGFGRGDSPAS